MHMNINILQLGYIRGIRSNALAKFGPENYVFLSKNYDLTSTDTFSWLTLTEMPRESQASKLDIFNAQLIAHGSFMGGNHHYCNTRLYPDRLLLLLRGASGYSTKLFYMLHHAQFMHSLLSVVHVLLYSNTFLLLFQNI